MLHLHWSRGVPRTSKTFCGCSLQNAEKLQSISTCLVSLKTAKAFQRFSPEEFFQKNPKQPFHLLHKALCKKCLIEKNLLSSLMRPYLPCIVLSYSFCMGKPTSLASPDTTALFFLSECGSSRRQQFKALP